MEEPRDDYARVRKMVRGQMQRTTNYWDYLIGRLGSSAQELSDLRSATKTDLAFLFVNKFI